MKVADRTHDPDAASLDRPTRFRTDRPAVIARLAVRALLDELATYPKPGLVSLVDRGSHDDMDAASFIRSARSLRSYFREVVELGGRHGDLAALRAAGVAAEARMLRATRGVNTHRGAIFLLGILAAAAARRGFSDRPLDQVVREAWSGQLREHRRDEASHGGTALGRYGVGGAVAEAVAGFPHVFDVALPALTAALRADRSIADARVHAFFATMAVLEDTNLLHRGGVDGLARVRRLASGFVARGGVLAPDWRRDALAMHRELCARRLSPGGSADVLTGALFVHALLR